MTTENRRAVGTLGLAAVVVVLAVSMIAMNFTAQPAAADHIAAKKAGGYYGMLKFLRGRGFDQQTIFGHAVSSPG